MVKFQLKINYQTEIFQWTNVYSTVVGLGMWSLGFTHVTKYNKGVILLAGLFIVMDIIFDSGWQAIITYLKIQ